ncbi:MAG: hypothetical protein M1817_006722 [Caeruleum heppii]|nr:MAG: hypothetical protein M1817_006722 [Caeruleum heppii]
MNGDAHAASSIPTTAQLANGNSSTSPSEDISAIIRALRAVHDTQSTNDIRRQASIFLEDAKHAPHAPSQGYTLAADASQPAVVRHYALSLLEQAIRYDWPKYSDEQALTLKDWVLNLSHDVREPDPPYIRNKMAQLWLELAKRSWAAPWLDMDELLVRLWSKDLVHQEFVAVVLEGLSEDVFNKEDTVAVLRGSRLSKACVDIFTSAPVLLEQFPHRSTSVNVRYGDEGWLVRLSQFLDRYLSHPEDCTEKTNACAVKIVAALRAAVAWAVPRAIVAARCSDTLCKALEASSPPVQMAAIEALHALYSRSHFQDDEFVSLVTPLFSTEHVQLFRKLYQRSITDATDIDEDKYQLGKKISELLSNLGNYIEERPHLLPASSDLPGFFSLLLHVLNSQSLTISIPVLNTWTKIVKSVVFTDSGAVAPLVGSLLDTCSQRIFRYDMLPEGSDDPSYLFLLEDIETLPERHAFLGNYRRFCTDVVQVIVHRNPFGAMYHVLNHADRSLQGLYTDQPDFRVETYKRNSIPLLRADAACTVVEAAVKGFVSWKTQHGTSPQSDERQRIELEGSFESWCARLLDSNIEDPLIRKRILALAVAISTTALHGKADFMLNVLKHILITRPVDVPAYPEYSEAVKDLQQDCTHELHRLAMKMPDHLINVYGDLEAKVNEIVATYALDDRQRISCYVFLFIISHRSTTLDSGVREQRLQAFIRPIKQSWQQSDLDRSLQSFESFGDLVGLSKVQAYLLSRRAHEVEDWSKYQLDDEGKAIQAELSARFQDLPLRPTKAFLGASVDKVKKGSQQWHIAASLWHDAIPLILPDLLKFLSWAHAACNPGKWSDRPEMHAIVTRTLQDRFWQAGISTGSRDDFYARVSGNRTTLEGFASSVRGAIRTIRETCYSILFAMSRLDRHFYGFEDLPSPLTRALFTDAQSLSSHQLSTMMNMVRYLIDDCPVGRRGPFLTPLLTTLFTELDNKISAEWELLGHKAQANAEDDNLTDEMRDESILRQLTYSTVMLVAGLLDPQRKNPPDPMEAPTEVSSHTRQRAVLASTEHAELPGGETVPNSMRAFALSSLEILQPLVLFCTHALHMRDSRCCGIIIRVFRSILPEFGSESETDTAIREYMCSEVLKAAIMSLHNPYFVDLQKDLAHFIATLYLLYAPKSNTPRQVLLSLPGISEEKVRRTSEQLFSDPNVRHQRALILNLLDGLRGVSISEQGRVLPRPDKKGHETSVMLKGYTKADDSTAGHRRQGSVDLSGMADMFG